MRACVRVSVCVCARARVCACARDLCQRLPALGRFLSSDGLGWAVEMRDGCVELGKDGEGGGGRLTLWLLPYDSVTGAGSERTEERKKGERRT